MSALKYLITSCNVVLNKNMIVILGSIKPCSILGCRNDTLHQYIHDSRDSSTHKIYNHRHSCTLQYLKHNHQEIQDSYPVKNILNFIFGFINLPTSFDCSSGRLQNCFRFNLPFSVSFVFPTTFINVLNKFSMKLCLVCITSKLCLISKVCQYGNSQKILLFVQL